MTYEKVNQNDTSLKLLKKDFFKYMVPSVISMWVSALYIMVDGIFVSKGVGPNALASVNLTVPFVNLIFGISVLFSIGTSSMVSSLLGQGQKDKASKYFSMSLSFLVAISLIVSILGFTFIDEISILLGATIETIEVVKSYLGVIIFFAPFYMISYALEVLIKVDGYPSLSTFGVLISAITNIVLDYLFVFIFNWGVEGAGLATGLARVFSFLFFMTHFLSKKSTLKISKFKFEFNAIKKITSIGFADCMTEFSTGIIILLFNQCILTTIGDAGLITYSIISYINTLVLSTMLGISQGLQPLSSYYNGNQNKLAIKRLLKISIKTVSVFSMVILAICLLFGDLIVLMFIDKSDMKLFNYSVNVFKLFSISFALLGFNVVTSGFLSSIQKAKDASLISVGRGFVVIFTMTVISIILFGGNGIWLSSTMSELLVLLFTITRIRKELKVG